jgi:hypothetical protein
MIGELFIDVFLILMIIIQKSKNFFCELRHTKLLVKILSFLMFYVHPVISMESLY